MNEISAYLKFHQIPESEIGASAEGSEFSGGPSAPSFSNKLITNKLQNVTAEGSGKKREPSAVIINISRLSHELRQ